MEPEVCCASEVASVQRNQENQVKNLLEWLGIGGTDIQKQDVSSSLAHDQKLVTWA